MRTLSLANVCVVSAVFTLLTAGVAFGGSCAPLVEFDAKSLVFDGKRSFLVSGEFHYFRVPRKDWRRRLELLKETGANCVATYIPWCIHEPKEGRVLFGDCDERNLDAFLKTVEDVGLMALVRPGPYQYSELVYGGLPRWLVENHPEIAMLHNGKPLGMASVDYNHPVFLEQTRRYFREVAKVLAPHQRGNGGCIAMVQLDNETMGIHVWNGYPTSRGYLEGIADYISTLRTYLEEDGISGPFCLNAGSAPMVSNYRPVVGKLGKSDFLLGYDHYYNLGDVWSRTHPDDHYFLQALQACDILKGFGYPPVGLEIQAGTIGETVPILKNDLLACHMANLAAGARGINYYVFTGGPNVPGTGTSCDVYDYAAPVAADGSLRPTYEAIKEFGGFVAAHPELLDAERASAVQLVLEWPDLADFADLDRACHEGFVASSLLISPYSPETVLMDCRSLDVRKPAVLAGVRRMSAESQSKLAGFVRSGGSLLAIPDFPRLDLEGKPCTVLADALSGPASSPVKVDGTAHPVTVVEGRRLFSVSPQRVFAALPQGAVPLAVSEDGTRTYGAAWPIGAGKVALLAVTWKPKFFVEIEALGAILERLGAVKTFQSTNPTVLSTVWRLNDGSVSVFAMNFHASPQSVTITVPTAGTSRFNLQAMSVGYSLQPLQK